MTNGLPQTRLTMDQKSPHFSQIVTATTDHIGIIKYEPDGNETMSKFGKRKNGLAKFTAAAAGIFALLLVVSPAFAADADYSTAAALSVILPALAFCSAIIVGVWHQMSRTKQLKIRVRR